MKYDILRGPDGSWNGIDTRPAATKNSRRLWQVSAELTGISEVAR